MSNPTPQTTMDRVREKIGAFFDVTFSLPTMLFLLLVAALIFIYKTATGEDSRIADIDYARGLITLLFAVGTIAVALVLTFAAVFQNSSDGDNDDKRFERGRDVLGVLIGIFGTIVGFYFGSVSTDAKTDSALTVTSVSQTTIEQNAEPPLTIIGTNFSADCVVLFGKQPLVPSQQTSTQIVVNITKSQSATKGILKLKVLDTTSGRLSNSIPIEIK